MTKNCCCCCCCYCRKKRPKCPQQLTDCEGSQCQELRSLVASQGYDAATNIVYNYTQVSRYFHEAVAGCTTLGVPYRLATLSELSLLSHLFFYIDEDGNNRSCPTLVWSTENGKPVIVRIAPCNAENIEILRKFDLDKCKAQVICVAAPDSTT